VREPLTDGTEWEVFQSLGMCLERGIGTQTLTLPLFQIPVMRQATFFFVIFPATICYLAIDPMATRK
jgi:hypothetical protein